MINSKFTRMDRHMRCRAIFPASQVSSFSISVIVFLMSALYGFQPIITDNLSKAKLISENMSMSDNGSEMEDDFHKVDLSTSEILFYEFDTKTRPDINVLSLEPVSQSEHESDSANLTRIDTDEDEIVDRRGNQLVAFNLLASNRVGLFRLIPDTRRDECKVINEHFKSNSNISLRASIVICHYNEAPSALLRTLYSILKRTPKDLIQEIIVVDDASEDEYKSDKYESFFDPGLIRFVRTSKREGLVRARLFGSRMSKGDVIVFLDSHVEANIGWLEPLLEIIQQDKTTIASPMIDLISPKTLIYTSSPMVRGGLKWDLNFKWDSVPSSLLKTNEDFVRPIDSPTMAGGLYAIHRDYFLQIGEYDEAMDLWGGENVEISLRTWLCGGRVVILPCSRMGHIFRTTRPYGPEPGKTDTLLVNSHRTARIWLDEFIEEYYEANPQARELEHDDISLRLELRQKLNCRNFSWFLDNVYPDLKQQRKEAQPDLSANKAQVTPRDCL